MDNITFAAIIVIVAIVWSIYLTVKVWIKMNWAWAILCFAGCCMVTPLGVYFFLKLLDID